MGGRDEGEGTGEGEWTGGRDEGEGKAAGIFQNSFGLKKKKTEIETVLCFSARYTQIQLTHITESYRRFL